MPTQPADPEGGSCSKKVAMPKEVKCRTCGVAAAFLGQIAFMQKGDSVFWGLVAAFTDRDAANLETFPVDVFRCPNCGHLELYDLDRSLPEANR